MCIRDRNNLQAISMLPNYNPTYAAVLGGVNAAGSIYGAGKQGGWWNSTAQPGAPPPVDTTTTWMGGNRIY